MSIIKCEWSKKPNEKAEAVRLDKKIKFNYMLSTRDILYIQDCIKDEWERIYYGKQ